mgnify:CR=1 FL=1
MPRTLLLLNTQKNIIDNAIVITDAWPTDNSYTIPVNYKGILLEDVGHMGHWINDKYDPITDELIKEIDDGVNLRTYRTNLTTGSGTVSSIRKQPEDLKF